ncbi:hypothetical protein P7K49_021018 [Saguinus oedipus]|uniref:Uncharacterized protein n=1 Tax=Saguinus oedipus TaxID=9490 RepID=A0ABQ9US68_SAGOE|nr:hypothetical protein P7K49_021018 [Saguinus oedipus]
MCRAGPGPAPRAPSPESPGSTGAPGAYPTSSRADGSRDQGRRGGERRGRKALPLRGTLFPVWKGKGNEQTDVRGVEVGSEGSRRLAGQGSPHRLPALALCDHPWPGFPGTLRVRSLSAVGICSSAPSDPDRVKLASTQGTGDPLRGGRRSIKKLCSKVLCTWPFQNVHHLLSETEGRESRIPLMPACAYGLQEPGPEGSWRAGGWWLDRGGGWVPGRPTPGSAPGSLSFTTLLLSSSGGRRGE